MSLPIEILKAQLETAKRWAAMVGPLEDQIRIREEQERECVAPVLRTLALFEPRGKPRAASFKPKKPTSRIGGVCTSQAPRRQSGADGETGGASCAALGGSARSKGGAGGGAGGASCAALGGSAQSKGGPRRTHGADGGTGGASCAALGGSAKRYGGPSDRPDGIRVDSAGCGSDLGDRLRADTESMSSDDGESDKGDDATSSGGRGLPMNRGPSSHAHSEGLNRGNWGYAVRADPDLFVRATDESALVLLTGKTVLLGSSTKLPSSKDKSKDPPRVSSRKVSSLQVAKTVLADILEGRGECGTEEDGPKNVLLAIEATLEKLNQSHIGCRPGTCGCVGTALNTAITMVKCPHEPIISETISNSIVRGLGTWRNECGQVAHVRYMPGQKAGLRELRNGKNEIQKGRTIGRIVFTQVVETRLIEAERARCRKLQQTVGAYTWDDTLPTERALTYAFDFFLKDGMAMVRDPLHTHHNPSCLNSKFVSLLFSFASVLCVPSLRCSSIVLM
jgi:hypothetical protein